ncbi:hypothetical protein [Bacillus sp. Marseille-Q3570]|uniref:hypothetical protein n=1 Tax=Bacillus sp. Marseille-Q3570 TaxID=2963522 RepID=UPI0021B793C5|nr:hypothetical protein [Bacillus sp. Marseille-Q3570]
MIAPMVNPYFGEGSVLDYRIDIGLIYFSVYLVIFLKLLKEEFKKDARKTRAYLKLEIRGLISKYRILNRGDHLNKKNKIIVSSMVVLIIMAIPGFYMIEKEEERQELIQSLTSLENSFDKLESYVNNAENDGFTLDEIKNMWIFKSLFDRQATQVVEDLEEYRHDESLNNRIEHAQVSFWREFRQALEEGEMDRDFWNSVADFKRITEELKDNYEYKK